MATWITVFVSGWLGLAAVCSAAEVRLLLPDAQLRGAIHDMSGWYHLCREGTDEERAQCAATAMVKLISAGHYAGLNSIQATMTIRFDESAP